MAGTERCSISDTVLTSDVVLKAKIDEENFRFKPEVEILSVAFAKDGVPPPQDPEFMAEFDLSESLALQPLRIIKR